MQEQLDLPATDPLAAAMLPVLVHRMNNTTQLLSNLHAILQADGGTDWLGERADDLAHSATDVHQLGYLLAVLSSSAGADLLLARREADGIELMLRAVADIARRAGRRLSLPDDGLPKQSAEVHRGWELPWAFGALLHQAVMELPEGEALQWRIEATSDSWVLRSSRAFLTPVGGLRALLEERLPETVLELDEDGWRWLLPRAWLTASDPIA